MTFPLFLALKYLKPKRSGAPIVTLLAVLGVVLGVAIIIIVRAVMTGFGDMWREKILAFKPHVLIISHQGRIDDDAQLTQLVSQVPGVSAASSSIEARVLTERQGRILAPVVIGVSLQNLSSLHPNLASSLLEGSADLEDDEVLVGSDFAWQMDLRLGDKFLVYSPMNLISKDELFFPEEVRVGGIFHLGQRDFDGNYVIASLPFARDLMGWTRGASSIQVKTDCPEDPVAFGEIVSVLRSKLPPSYEVRTWQEVDREIFNALAVEKNMMVILLGFITIVAIFCVTITLIVIIIRKTDEIGLLKALGFSSRQIMGTFVLYGWIQCLVGTVLGIGLAFLVLNQLQPLVNLLARFGVEVFPKNVYGLDQIPWRVLPGEVVQVAVSVIVFCTLASFIPALRAARKDPVEALRG